MKVLEIFSLIIILSPIGQVFGAQASGGHHKRARVEQVGSIQKKRARISCRSPDLMLQSPQN
jgi:hypothetical protein